MFIFRCFSAFIFRCFCGAGELDRCSVVGIRTVIDVRLGPNLVGPELGVDLPDPLGRVGVVPLCVGEDLMDFRRHLHPAAADRQVVAGAHHQLGALGTGRAQEEACAAHRDAAAVSDDDRTVADFAIWRLTGNGKVGLEEHTPRFECLVSDEAVGLGFAAALASACLLIV